MSDAAKLAQYKREAQEIKALAEWAMVAGEWEYIVKAAEEANKRR